MPAVIAAVSLFSRAFSRAAILFSISFFSSALALSPCSRRV